MPTRATVRLPVDCDNRCVFCVQDGLGVPAATARDRLEAARARADEVTFVGGEPTLDPALAGHVAAARAMGFARVGVQSHGRHLAQAGAIASLREAGLTDLHLSIHGAEPVVHDYHTGIPGSFGLALAAASAGHANGLAVVVATVLTRSNFRSLAAMPRLLGSRGVAGWLVAVPAVAGRAGAALDRVVPRLGLALPFALSALDAAAALGVEAFVSGAPRCLLGPLGRRALGEPGRGFADVCGGCPARGGCAGLDPAYLERFGGDEIGPARARMAGAPLDPAPASAIARMFVGAGDLGPAPRPAAARPGKVSLPIAGKPRPARGEASAASPRQSGDALRAILPGLFEASGEHDPEGRPS